MSLSFLLSKYKSHLSINKKKVKAILDKFNYLTVNFILRSTLKTIWSPMRFCLLLFSVCLKIIHPSINNKVIAKTLKFNSVLSVHRTSVCPSMNKIHSSNDSYNQLKNNLARFSNLTLKGNVMFSIICRKVFFPKGCSVQVWIQFILNF